MSSPHRGIIQYKTLISEQNEGDVHMAGGSVWCQEMRHWGVAWHGVKDPQWGEEGTHTEEGV